jgi:hypothetical protein
MFSFKGSKQITIACCERVDHLRSIFVRDADQKLIRSIAPSKTLSINKDYLEMVSGLLQQDHKQLIGNINLFINPLNFKATVSQTIPKIATFTLTSDGKTISVDPSVTHSYDNRIVRIPINNPNFKSFLLIWA